MKIIGESKPINQHLCEHLDILETCVKDKLCYGCLVLILFYAHGLRKKSLSLSPCNLFKGLDELVPASKLS